MPLSKAKQAEWMREYRKRTRYNVIPKPATSVIPRLTEVVTSKEDIPVYNPAIHRAGDTVRVLVGNKAKVIKIPELDADGQPIPW